MAAKQHKKALQLSELIDIEKKLHGKYSKIVNNILTLAKKESKKGKLKTQADRLKIIEEELVKIDTAIDKQSKLEKKESQRRLSKKKKNKAEKSKKKEKDDKASKIKADKKKEKKVTPKKTPKQPTSATKLEKDTVVSSTKMNAKMAIATLQQLDTKEQVNAFVKGETRSTVLSRANSRINALS